METKGHKFVMSDGMNVETYWFLVNLSQLLIMSTKLKFMVYQSRPLFCKHSKFITRNFMHVNKIYNAELEVSRTDMIR